MKRYKSIGISLVLSVAILAMTSCGNKADENQNTANTMETKEERVAVEAITEQEMMDSTCYTVGMQQYASQRYADSIVSLLKVSDESVYKSAAMVSVANAYMHMGDFESAEEEIADYLKRYDLIVSNCCGTGMTGTSYEIESTKGAEAIMNFMKAQDRYSSDENILQLYLLLSRCYEILDKDEYALKTLDEAEKIYNSTTLERERERLETNMKNEGKLSISENAGNTEVPLIKESEKEEHTADSEETEQAEVSEEDYAGIDSTSMQQLFEALKNEDYITAYDLIFSSSLEKTREFADGVYFSPAIGKTTAGIESGEGVFLRFEQNQAIGIACAFYSTWDNGIKNGEIHAMQGIETGTIEAISSTVNGQKLNGDYSFIHYMKKGEQTDLLSSAEGTVTDNNMAGETMYTWNYASESSVAITLYEGTFMDSAAKMEYSFNGADYMIQLPTGEGIPIRVGEMLTMQPAKVAYVIQELNNQYVSTKVEEEKAESESEYLVDEEIEFNYQVSLAYAKGLNDRWFYNGGKAYLVLFDFNALKTGQTMELRWRENLDGRYDASEFEVSFSDPAKFEKASEIEYLPADDCYRMMINVIGNEGGNERITVNWPSKKMSVFADVNVLAPHTVQLADGKTDIVYGYIDYETADDIFYYTNQYRLEHGMEPLERVDNNEYSVIRAVETGWYDESIQPPDYSEATQEEWETYCKEATETYQKSREELNETKAACESMSQSEYCEWLKETYGEIVNPWHIRPNGENAGPENSALITDLGRSVNGYKSVYSLWHSCPGHRLNMIDPDYKYLSTGCFVGEFDTYYFVQNFYTEKP